MKRINTSTASIGIAATSLFIALGGPAQAASLITGASVKNSSLTGADVRNNSLTGADIRNIRGGDVRSNSLNGTDIRDIRSGDVRDGSLRARDFAKGQLPSGPQGLAGVKGDKGDTGPAGPSRWLLVNRNGQIEAQSGGFRIANAYPAGGAGEANVYIESGDPDLSNNGIVSTIALENQYSLDANPVNTGRNAGPDANPEFSGEITASRCAIAGVVACAPADTTANGGDGVTTNRNNYFVVSPRNSDGSFTRNDSAPGANDNDHKRFYVVISGPQD